jgi:Protein of unknown function (DUF2958)
MAARLSMLGLPFGDSMRCKLLLGVAVTFANCSNRSVTHSNESRSSFCRPLPRIGRLSQAPGRCFSVWAAELRTVRGKLGLPVERDEHFDADKTLSVYADEARQHGGIVT